MAARRESSGATAANRPGAAAVRTTRFGRTSAVIWITSGIGVFTPRYPTLTFRASAAGTEVTYPADFTFKGIARLVAPLLRPALARLGNEAETGMAAALARL